MEAAAEKASVETAAKYVPIAELGRGGMATAYLASFSGPGGFNKLMVVKRLRPGLAAEPDFLRMFLEEARLAARIDHPNIVHTSEVGFDGTNHFIAMEFVDGQPLENVIRRTKARAVGPDASPADREAAPSLPLNLHLHIVTQVLEALEFAHALKDYDGTPLNVVHRDVSPHNVMVTYEGHVKLLDFGIAKAADSTADTRTGFLKGKCAYMAPEQFGGEHVDKRADIFAVGIMLWQAIAGRRLWRGLSDTEIFARLAKDQVPSPRTVVPDVDEKLEQICMKALAVDPNNRYGTAADFQSALEEYIAAKPELRASPRDLGKFVSEIFAKEHAKIRSLVESQLAKSKRNPSDVMSLAEYFGHSGPPARSEVTPSVASTQPSPGSRSKSKLGLLVGVAVLLVGVIAVALQTRKTTTETKGTSASSQPVSDQAQVSIRVEPPEAKVTFDGVALTGTPPTGSFPLDNGRHQVRVEAAGYTPRTEELLLDSNRVTMEVSLERAGVKPSPSAEAAPTSSQAVQPQRGKPAWAAGWHPSTDKRRPNNAPPASTPAEPSPPQASAAPPTPPPPGFGQAFTPKRMPIDPSDPWDSGH